MLEFLLFTNLRQLLCSVLGAHDGPNETTLTKTNASIRENIQTLQMQLK